MAYGPRGTRRWENAFPGAFGAGRAACDCPGMLRAFRPGLADVQALLRLAGPIVAVQVGGMLMGVVDTMVMGHVSATELAATALGNLYYFGLNGLGMGIVWAIDPIVSQAMGARDHERAALGIQRGVVLGVVLGVIMSLLCLPAGWVFSVLRQDAAVVPRATAFVHTSAVSLVFMLTYITLRQCLQAMKHTEAILRTVIVGNVVNLALNLVLVFGRFGLPAMGCIGSAIASTIARLTMLVMLLVLSRPQLEPMLRPWRREALEWAPLARTFRLGLPLGLQNMVEFTTFAGISVLVGWFGADAMGGHQVALTLATLTFMVPLGVGSAGSVLVGHAIGAGDMPHARRVAASALLVGVSFMAISACVLLAVPGFFASLYTDVAGVAAMATVLIPIAGVFQIFDGMQVVAAGVLRGAGDTHAPLVVNVAGFWVVGMPVSLWLGFRAGLGVAGLWWGFVAGLVAVAAFMVMRVHIKLSREVRRLDLDAPEGAAH